MALMKSNGIPIPLSPGPAAVFGAPTPPPLRPQKATQWCWAACAEMTAAAVSQPQSLQQCSLASRYHNVTGCCQQITSACNKPASINTIDDVFTDHSISFTYDSSSIPETDVLSQLAQGMFIEVGWHTPGHVALIVSSYQNGSGQNVFVVHDPLPVNIGTIHRASYSGLKSLGSYTNWKSTWHSLS
jgi:hypothetical protein